ncbi:unnamed protein product [Caenorhabditis sp. 36 PRJEB53466]|nr:unnamed protein product [Caenorhabditis sp. 36 PRJEB53466]
MRAPVVFLLPLALILQGVICDSVCKTVTCYGQSVCHEVSLPCANGTIGCYDVLAKCSDKSIEDYAKDLLTNQNLETLLTDPNYMQSNDKDVLCQGFSCYGLNNCIIVRVACIDDPNCVNYLPFCDDSPQLVSTT